MEAYLGRFVESNGTVTWADLGLFIGWNSGLTWFWFWDRLGEKIMGIFVRFKSEGN